MQHDQVKLVLQTWGPKCDGFFVASNLTDPSIHAVAIPNTRHDYLFLFEKHCATLRYMHEHGYLEQYDWFFKTDTDTYLIMENLKAYLMSDAVQSRHPLQRPLMIGRLMSKRGNIKTRKYQFIPVSLREEFLRRSLKGTMIYTSGAGYAMNKVFMQRIIPMLDTDECLQNQTKSEDVYMGFCYLFMFTNAELSDRPVVHLNARDEQDRERFHIETPSITYDLKDSYLFWHRRSHNENLLGILNTGPKAISNSTIAFHHLTDDGLLSMHKQLFYCREKGNRTV